MKKSLRMLTTATLLTLGLASFGVTQMMGEGHDHSMMNQSGSTSKSDMGNMGMTGDMGDMSKGCKMMLNNFGKLQEHFDTMLQIDDINALKTEMKKHQEMLQVVYDNMSEHQSMCMNMMNSDEKMGKMGKMGCGMMMGQSTKNQDN